MTTRCGRWQCLFLAAMLAMGAGLAWGFLGAILVATAETVLRPVNTYQENEDLMILCDGTPIIQSNRYYGIDARTLRTLDGKEFKFDKPLLHAESGCILPGPRPSRDRFHRMTWPQRIAHVSGTVNNSLWYFVHDGSPHGRGYFAGYDNETRLLIGYIGRAGFRPDEPPVADQFTVDNRSVMAGQAISQLSSPAISEECRSWLAQGEVAHCCYLMVDDGVVLIDLANRSAMVVLKDPDFISASSMNGLLVVRDPDRIRILQPSGKEVRSYPLPPPLRGDVNIQFIGLAKNKVVLYDRSFHPFAHHAPRHVFWLDADGKIARQERVALGDRVQPPWISPPVENLLTAMVAIPSPGTILAGISFDAWQRIDSPHRLRELWPEWWPALLGTTIISAVLAVCCYRRQRRYALPWPCVWAAFVLLFGVPAYLGYLVHRLWPARLPCPKCGRLVPRDRPACAVCRQDFPAPALKGIEVFA